MQAEGWAEKGRHWWRQASDDAHRPVTIALVLFVALVTCGWLFGEGLVAMERAVSTVDARGLAEGHYRADSARLLIDFTETMPDEAGARLRASQDDARVRAFLARAGFDVDALKISVENGVVDDKDSTSAPAADGETGDDVGADADDSSDSGAQDAEAPPPDLADPAPAGLMPSPPPLRQSFKVRHSLSLTTRDVDRALALREHWADLIRQGVPLNSNSGIGFFFDRLDVVKPGLITASVKNSRLYAQQFTHGTPSSVGGIRAAQAPQISVEGGKGSPEPDVTVRVITDTSFFLK